MSLDAWLAFCAMDVVLCFIPGPAVLFVVSAALGGGGRSGVLASLGIVTGNTFYFALSATGLAAVLVASHELFTALKYAGAAYLVWVGARMMLAPSRASASVEGSTASRSFTRGLVVQASNPKALVFFVALVPQFIDPRTSLAVQTLVLGVSSIAIELAVLGLYVWTAVRARRLAGAHLATSLERAGGAFLLATGVRLAFVDTR